ncbi:MAG: choice-of-anchor J domain-containing protein [Flavobacteriales bacterium]|nr:choice-of-anchor J domain-containing protein [Flavobacteriales bacterium]
MKRNLLLFFCVLISFAGMSQNILFSEDFENSETMPSNILVFDVDGQTPASAVSWCTNAWTVRTEFADPSNNVAGSISWYSPAGTSNDWMVIPGIAIQNTGTNLRWRAKAQDPDYPDGYEVYISTTGTNPNDFTGSSPVFSVAAEDTAWTVHSVNLDTYVGSTINIAFRNNSNDMFVLMVDDIAVGETGAVDVALNEVSNDKFSIYPNNISVAGQIRNIGFTDITSLDIKWTDGTTTYTETISGINVTPLQTYNFTHSDNIAISGSDLYRVTVWADASNDVNHMNDTSKGSITGIPYKPTRVMVAEEGTGTWCGWCPRGEVNMEQMLTNNPSTFIGIAVHNGDPMAETTYDQNVGALLPGYPSSIVNRDAAIGAVDPGDWSSTMPAVTAKTVPNEVWVTAEHDASNMVTITVKTNILGTIEGDYRFAGAVLENNVTGGAGYEQTNYYAGGSNGAMGGYENLPDPVPASQMVYNHVARTLLGGWDGVNGSLPVGEVPAGQYEHQFTYQIPSGSNVEDFEFVGFLIDNASGEILNAGKQKSFPVSVYEQTKSEIIATVFPNPFNEVLNIDFMLNETSNVEINMFNTLGELVKSESHQDIANGRNLITINSADLENGIYFLQINTAEGSIEKKVILNK